jgi:amino acid transporter
VLITVIATSRVAFSMARDKEIPGGFARLLPRRQTPWAAALLTCAMAALLIPVGNVKMLAEMSSFAALAAFFAVNASLLVLRHRMPGRERPFRVPFSLFGVPVPPVAAIAAIGILLFHFEWQIYAAGAGALALTGIAFAVRQFFRKRGKL